MEQDSEPPFRSLLAAKIRIPTIKPDIYARPRLTTKISPSLQSRGVLLILAPRGFGKTTLVSQWAKNNESRVAWFSADEGDNDPAVFWDYFGESLCRVCPELKDDHLPGISSFKKQQGYLVELINRLTVLKNSVVFVLDNLQCVNSQKVWEGLSFFIDHIPENLNLVLISNQKLPFSFDRIREKIEVSEIGTADLSFDISEIRNMQTELSDQAVDEIFRLTGGWAAAIHLLLPQPKNLEVSPAFSIGQIVTSQVKSQLNRFLDACENDLKTFLVEISVVDVITTDLATTLTGRQDATDILSALQKDCLWIMSVPGETDRLFFHPVFLNALREQFTKYSIGQLQRLHKRAAEWYEVHGRPADAVDHALRIGDYDLAVAVAERSLFKIMDCGELTRQSELLRQLPEDILHARPGLSIANAWLFAYTGKLQNAEHCLKDAENVLPNTPSKDARRNMLGKILAVRSYIHWLSGECEKTIKTACQALINLDDLDGLDRCASLVSLGSALEETGHLSDSLDSYTEAITISRKKGSTHIQALACAGKVRVLVCLGRLKQADSFAESTLMQIKRCQPEMMDQLPALGNVFAHQAEIHRYWNDLPKALELANEGVRIGEKWGHADTTITTCAVKAAVLWQMNRKQEAMEIMERVRDTARLVSPWYLQYLESYVVLLGMGTEHYVKTCSDVLTRLQEQNGTFDHSEIILLRAGINIFYQQRKFTEANRWLTRIEIDAQQTGARMSMADINIMQALCEFGLGNFESASRFFRKGLDIVDEENAICLVLDKAGGMEGLLRMSIEEDIYVELCRRALSLLNPGYTKFKLGKSLHTSMTGSEECLPGLSKREIEILNLLTTHLTSTEIARELIVSPNTVRFHIKSIYDKLDVHSRNEAVENARRLRLV